MLGGNRAQKKDFTILMELSVSRTRGPEVMKNYQGGKEPIREIGKRQSVDTVLRLCMGPAQPGAPMLTQP